MELSPEFKEVLKKQAWDRSTSTKDGVKIEVGLRVVDYNRDHGEIIAEYDGAVGNNYGTDEEPDHWFSVKTDKGGRSSMNAERLYSERNFRKGM